MAATPAGAPDTGEGPFVDDGGRPILQPCALLFLDLLGVRAMATGPDAGKQLVELASAMRRPLGDFLGDDSPWQAAFFSDTLVLLDPLTKNADVEAALILLAVQASWIQVNLVAAGIFLRGALTIGDAHFRDGLLFGPALVEAHDIESKVAVNPRVVLGESAVAAMREAMEDHGPQEAGYLRVEQDGSVFIDYLDILLDDVDDPAPHLMTHRDMVHAKLAETTSDSRRWEKYRWVAEYHNDFCRHELPGLPDLLIATDPQSRTFTRMRV